jgi:polar amino acid transport system permease protein
MPEPSAPSIVDAPLPPAAAGASVGRRLIDLPWWFIGIVVVILWAGVGIFTRPNFNEAFQWIKVGLLTTLLTSLTAYLLAIVIGLLTGLGRMSHNVVIRNGARLYVELVRGIPMLVLIFFIAFVGVPAGIDLLHSLGLWFASIGFTGVANLLAGLENQAVPMLARAIIALAITYGAFLAEVFRAGIQSIGRGQMEAARSLGMGYGQAMRFVILPQAIRNILPALGNDFVSMVKDSSLVSVLAVRDMTQIARLYAGSTFRFREAYVTLAVLYLTLTVVLSLGVATIERRMRKHE